MEIEWKGREVKGREAGWKLNGRVGKERGGQRNGNKMEG